MSPRRVVVLVVGSLLLLVGAAAGTAYGLLRASLPALDGSRAVRGTAAPATIERDARGRTTVRAADRVDLAFALGYAHGQDRFFQMDLLRRAGAGRLAALIGPLGFAYDREARTHGLGHAAREAFAAAPAEHRSRLEAYAAGVNAGREDASARPWEYFLLRARPEPWRAVDTYLVLQAMTRDLQPPDDRFERARPWLRESLHPAVFEALDAGDNPWDTPVVGSARPAPVVPVPPGGPGRDDRAVGSEPAPRAEERSPRGSNSFAVDGSLTADGRAILANDMHLGLSLPTLWYAVRMVVDDGFDAVGVTLPGAPALIAGSNGSIAWGFTNSYGDWVDHVVIEVDPADSTRYRTPDGFASFEERVEVIEIASAPPETVRVRTTTWGPVIGEDPRGRPLATRWTAHDPAAVNVRLFDLAEARSVDDALDLAPLCGIPHQNLVVADEAGRIGWTIIGRMPRRVGFDGTEPVSWADGTRGWSGWWDPQDVPRHVDPPDGRLWTANGRVTTLENQRRIGDAGHALGVRARVIRDALRAIEAPDEVALFAVQNETESPLLARWFERLRAVVAASPDPRHRAIERWFGDWTGGADAASVTYRVVRAWRGEIVRTVEGALLAPARDRASDPDISLRRREPVVWSLLEERPAWVPPPFETWDGLERAPLDTLIAVWGEPEAWGRRTWGARNTTRIEHPLAVALPGPFAGALRLPPRAVDGDAWTARVNGPRFGASDRLVVAPGAEERGILQLPGGNASHPLSDFRTGDYDDWVVGRPTPLLPGPAVHVLELRPVTP